MKAINFNSPVYRYDGVSEILNELLNGGEKKTKSKGVASYKPPMNVREVENQYELEFFVPGFNKKQFSISNVNDVLTVKGNFEEDEKVNTNNYTRREFQANSFERNIELPEDVEGDKIKANYSDGILKVMLPKKEMVVKDIEVEVPVN